MFYVSVLGKVTIKYIITKVTLFETMKLVFVGTNLKLLAPDKHIFTKKK